MLKNRTLAKVVLFGFSGVVDLAQIIIDFTGFGIAISEAVEVAMPFILFGLFSVFGISIITKPKRIASMFATGIGDALTGGMAPFWILDVWYIFSDVNKEDAEETAASQQSDMLSNTIRQPLYQNGARQPQQKGQAPTPIKLNQDGIRAPGGGLPLK